MKLQWSETSPNQPFSKAFVLRPSNVGQGLFLCGQQPSLRLLLRFASSAPLAFAISQAWESITKGSQSRFSKELWRAAPPFLHFVHLFYAVIWQLAPSPHAISVDEPHLCYQEQVQSRLLHRHLARCHYLLRWQVCLWVWCGVLDAYLRGSQTLFAAPIFEVNGIKVYM